MSTTRPIEKHLELQVAIFVVFLILGPLFVAAGALLLRSGFKPPQRGLNDRPHIGALSPRPEARRHRR